MNRNNIYCDIFDPYYIYCVFGEFPDLLVCLVTGQPRQGMKLRNLCSKKSISINCSQVYTQQNQCIYKFVSSFFENRLKTYKKIFMTDLFEIEKIPNDRKYKTHTCLYID